MPVVEKIGKGVTISHGYCRIISNGFDITINTNTLTAVYTAVVEYIKWYNKNV